MRLRRYDRLAYDWRPPDPRPDPPPFRSFTVVARQLTEAFSALAYGSGSARTWRLRCEASLRASRRRRGLPDA